MPVGVIGPSVGVSVSVCLRHDNISFMLYGSICSFESVLAAVMITSCESLFYIDYAEIYRSLMNNTFYVLL